ncbi:hypothetical protein [Nonomuraea sp. NPDC050310]|uniref:hypothetical protein n=1 Tax=Nonomuraea sp. NPDC050310 TaxID=3154935 RepID=UPI00340925DD
MRALMKLAGAGIAVASACVLVSSTPAQAGSYTCWLNGNDTCKTASLSPTNGAIIIKVSGDVSGTAWDAINNVPVGSVHCYSADTICGRKITGLTHKYYIKVTSNNFWDNGWGSIAS